MTPVTTHHIRLTAPHRADRLMVVSELPATGCTIWAFGPPHTVCAVEHPAPEGGTYLVRCEPDETAQAAQVALGVRRRSVVERVRRVASGVAHGVCALGWLAVAGIELASEWAGIQRGETDGRIDTIKQ